MNCMTTALFLWLLCGTFCAGFVVGRMRWKQ